MIRTPLQLKNGDEVMNVDLIYELPLHTQPSFAYGDEFIFYLQEGTKSDPKIRAVGLDGVKIDVQTPSLDKRINDLHVSSLSNHLAILCSKGSELGQIYVYEWELVDGNILFKTLFNTENSDKHYWGGFGADGIVYFNLKNHKIDELWTLEKRLFSNDQKETISAAGYWPEMLGEIDGKWVWRNKETAFMSTLNGNEGLIKARIRCARSDSHGNLLAIKDEINGLASELIEIEFDGETPKISTTLVSQEFILQQLRKDSRDEIPLAELQDFCIIKDDNLLLHFNDDGHSKLAILNPRTNEISTVSVDAITEKCSGSVWIWNINLSSDKRHLVVEVGNYHSPNHLWLLSLENETCIELTAPDMTFDTKTVSKYFSTSMPHHPNGLMQYFEITQTDMQKHNGQTVMFFHGGPALQTHLGRYSTEIIALVENGYKVIAPNPAGSLGRGGRHVDLDRGRERIVQFNSQIIPFTQHIIENSTRLHLFGGSYAGWLIAMILTDNIGSGIHSALVRNGVVDWNLFADDTSLFRKRNRAREYVGDNTFDTPAARAILKELSPNGELYCRNILFIIGEEDTRVPPKSTEGFLFPYFTEDVESVIHRFGDEGHGIKKFKNKVKLMKKALGLFDQR